MERLRAGTLLPNPVFPSLYQSWGLSWACLSLRPQEQLLSSVYLNLSHCLLSSGLKWLVPLRPAEGHFGVRHLTGACSSVFSMPSPWRMWNGVSENKRVTSWPQAFRTRRPRSESLEFMSLFCELFILVWGPGFISEHNKWATGFCKLSTHNRKLS